VQGERPSVIYQVSCVVLSIIRCFWVHESSWGKTMGCLGSNSKLRESMIAMWVIGCDSVSSSESTGFDFEDWQLSALTGNQLPVISQPESSLFTDKVSHFIPRG
jgi:hypothetical protein